MTALVVLLGAGAGIGIWISLAALVPAKPQLSSALAAIEASPTHRPPLVKSPGWQSPVVSWMRSIGLPSARTRRDLATIDRDISTHLATQVTGIVAGLVGPLLLGILASALGVGLGFVMPLWLSLIAAVAGYVVPELTVHKQAEATRAAYRHALATFLDLVVVSLSGGAGIDQAMNDAADTGNGPAFDAIRRALQTARLTRVAPWDTLSALGERVHLSEYRQLAATVGLAGDEGAKIRASLTARAATLRTAQLTRAEAEANQATERMSLPIVALFAAFLLLLGYPALASVLKGL